MDKEYQLDTQSVTPFMDYLKSMTETIGNTISDITENGIYNGCVIADLRDHLDKLESALLEEKPYLNGHYNPNYGDHRVCKCGHTYNRHFDSYENMEPVGCKYCGCEQFIEK